MSPTAMMPPATTQTAMSPIATTPNGALALVGGGPTAAEAAVTVESDLLGTIAVPAAGVFSFPAGMFGFPECRRFALVGAGREGLFWLQSLDHATLAFLLVDPFAHFADYTVELGAGDRADLAVVDAADVAILSVVTLPQTRSAPPTANLQGPVALNFAARLGRQLALGDSAWGVRCPFSLGVAAD